MVSACEGLTLWKDRSPKLSVSLPYSMATLPMTACWNALFPMLSQPGLMIRCAMFICLYCWASTFESSSRT